ncbi:ricin B lectin domain-containing protein [Rhizoctonia solani]|nr:ricin B lectin domain-containing protein [Rhizoctonia solani]
MAQNNLPAGTYIIKNASTGTVVDLWAGRADEGTAVQGFQYHGGDNQKWRLKWTGKGNQVTLQNVRTGTYIGHSPSGLSGGARVVGSKTPVPLLLVVADKGYAMEAADQRASVLDLCGGSRANEASIIYYPNNATDNQKWYFEKA